MSILGHFKNSAASVLTPTARLAVRYGPSAVRDGSFGYQVLRRFGWRSHTYVARSRMGFRVSGNTEDIIPCYIYYFGIWEPTISTWVRSLPLTGRTIIDIGANIGWYTLLGATCVGVRGRVVSIEASPLILEHLKRNLSLNGFKNVRLINVAAWNKFEDLPLFHSEPDNLGETTVVSALATKSKPDGYIKGAPLEALLLPEEVVSAGLVKIDVEGAEYQVVEGMLNLLPRFPKDVRFLMELKPNVLSKPVAEQLVRIFTDQGFRAYTVRNDYRPVFYQDWFASRIAEPIGVLSGISEQVDLILTREKLAADSFNYRVAAA